jgi:hypothetical protein
MFGTDSAGGVIVGRTIAYSEFKTLNDMIFGLLGWIYDIKFCSDAERNKETRPLLKTYFISAEKNGRVQKVLCRHILDVLDKRITKI